jgi:hypothetical protein
MRSSRETIYENLFQAGKQAQVGSNPAFVTTSRRWVHWSQVPAGSQPAFYQVQRKEKPEYAPTGRLGIPARWTLHASWIIYVNTGGDLTVVASSLLNPIIDALEATLPFFYQEGPNTLNGTLGVVDARIIDDEILIDEDVGGSQAVAILPVRIVAI